MLRDSLRSALTQEVATEVLVSDNASTDDTQTVLKEFRDPRLRVFTQPTLVPMAVHWNWLVSQASSDFIMLLSDDDSLDPEFLLHGLSCFQRHPDAALVFGASIIFDNDSNFRYRPMPVLQESRRFIVDLLSQKQLVPLCSVIFPTRALKAIGGFPESLRYSCDTAALIRIAAKARLVIHCPTAVCRYRIHSSSETNLSTLDSQVEDFRCLTQDALRVLAHTNTFNGTEDANLSKAASIGTSRVLGSVLYRQAERGLPRVQLLGAIWRHRNLLGGDPLFLLMRLLPSLIVPTNFHNGLRRLGRTIRYERGLLL